MSEKKVGKRLLTWVLVLVMTLSLLPLNVLAVENSNAGEKSSGIEFSKEVSKQPDADKNYTITMEAWATGTTTPTESVKPMDIVLVLDVSGSMDEGFTETTYKEYSSETPNSEFWNVKDNLYFKTNDSSYQKVTLERDATDFTYTAVTPTYNDIWYGEYYVKSNEAADAKRVTIKWYDRGFNSGYYLTIDDQIAGDPIRRWEWNDKAVAAGYTFYEKTASSYTYTYTYTDDNGDRQSTTVGNDQTIGWTLYARSEVSSTKMSALQSAVNSFIESVGNSSKDHRIAIVKFASDNSDEVGNDFTFWYGYNCSQIVMELTATDKNGVTQLENVVNDLSPAGATRSDYGMKHAKDIINASKAADTDDQRGRVVIMFTDGNPTDHRNFNVTVANGAISAAKDIKDVGAKVYTIGVFGEDPDDRINKYMNRVSSNCPNAFDMSEGGAGADADENAGYYSTAASADDLSRIFSSISSNISEATNKALDGKTEVNDVVSDYFDLATNDVNSIKVYTADRTADGGWADKQLVTDPSVTVALSGKTIKVSGYNYAANYITDEAKSDGTYGQKLIIEIKVKPSGKGYSDKEIPTNADTAGTHAAKVEVKSEDGTETTFVTSHETAKVTGHKVIYDLGGGTGNITGDRLYYPQGADVPVTNSEPTREGFKFTGWTPSTDNINVTAPTITEGKFTMPAANVTLTAQWETKTDLSYTVNYLEKGTNKVLHEPKTVSDVAFEDVITSANEVIDIDGYNYDSVDKETLTIGTDESKNVINIYYTKRGDLSYTVNYLEKTTNKVLHTQKTQNGMTFEDVITSANEVIDIDGYNYDSVDKDTLTIGTGENVINIYYTKKTGLSYKVNYLEKGTNKVLHTQKTQNGMTFEDVITSANEVIDIDGYNYDSADKEKLTIGTGENVINIYYTKRGDLSYTVNYLEKGTNKVLHTQKTVNNKAFEDVINSADEKIDIDGYNCDSVDKETLTIGTGENVINLYYTKRGDLSYTVNYLEKTTNKVLHAQKTQNGMTFEDVISSANEKINIDGYNYDSVDKETLTIGTGENVINIYYTKRGDLSYTVHYYLKGTTQKVANDKTVGSQTLNTVVTEKAIQISGYRVDGSSEKSITIVTGTNEIIFYYTRIRHPSTPTKPTVEIEDDDALGLNTTDHFAYIVGYGNGEVRPQNNITRAEVATIFFRLLTDDVRDENLTKTNRYSDVAATSWYNTAVSTLSSMGIITGYPDGTFRPNAAITRAEFAAIAARFDHDGDKTAAKFSDIATHWAKDEISIAYNNGWITGYPDGTFGPQRDITRAETMTLVNRVLNRQPETEDDLLPNMTVWTDNANPNAWYYLAVQEATNSHYYKFKTNSKYEKWTELRETRDWTQLEK